MIQGVGLAYIYTSLTLRNGFMLAFAAVAILLNSTITILIVSRIWYHQKFIKGALGSGYTRVYTRLIHLFVESAALIVVFNIAHIIVAQWLTHMPLLPHQLLAHVYVRSKHFPLLVKRLSGNLFER